MRRTREHCKRIGLMVTALSLVAPAAWAQAPKPAGSPKVVVSVGAHAPASPPNAKKLFASAESKRAAGDFEGALADYQASDAIAPTPASVEGIAFCHDKLGHFAEALTWYDGFLSNVPPALQAQGEAAKARVAAINAMPGHLRLESTPSNATVSIDGKEQATHTPLDVDLAPGKHAFHVTAPDHDAIDKEVQVTSRARQNLALELPLTPPPPPPPPPVVAAAPPPPPPSRSLVPAYVTGGLAIIAAGIGTGFGIAALNDKSNFNSHPTTATANTGEDHALVADMSIGIALTLGVTSIVLFTTRDEAAPAPAKTDLTDKAAKPSSDAPKPAGDAPKPSGDAPKPTGDAPKPTAALPFTFTAAPFVTPHGGGAGAVIRF